MVRAMPAPRNATLAIDAGTQPRPLHSMVRRRLIAMPGIQRKSDDIHQLVAKPGSHVGIQR